MALQALKGMKDVLPSDSYKWQYVENLLRNTCSKHGFREARTPVLEHTELFARGVGATTDIVQKEMYTFTDKGDRSVTLKPEGTAGFARMYIENNLSSLPQPQKLFYINNPIFRYERPQAGRLREHHQFGIEVYGAPSAYADAECILLVMDVLHALNLSSLKVKINSIGCPNCRPEYNKRLKEYLKASLDNMCATCRTRFDANPLRILDCKEKGCREICKNAPQILDCLCDDCAEHFENLKAALDAFSIPYEVDPMIVRGLDYYTRTVFEIVSDDLGAQNTVCGGGRYDGLIEQIGGPHTPAVGLGLGLERLLLILEETNFKFPEPEKPMIYMVSAGDPATLEAMRLVRNLRDNGIYCEYDHVGRSMKAQFKYADKLGVRYVVIIGDDELATGLYKLRNMETGEQVDVKREDVEKTVRGL